MTKNKKLTIIVAAALLVVAGIATIVTTQLNKTPIVPAETPPSQPPTDSETDIPKVDEFPQNPKEGSSVIKDGAYWDYSNGRWWEGEDVDAKWVDDSDKIVLCPLCGKIGRECKCPPVGH